MADQYNSDYFSFRVQNSSGDRRLYRSYRSGYRSAAYGSPVYATADGTVIVASYGYGGYGVAVVIDHGAESVLFTVITTVCMSVWDRRFPEAM